MSQLERVNSALLMKCWWKLVDTPNNTETNTIEIVDT